MEIDGGEPQVLAKPGIWSLVVWGFKRPHLLENSLSEFLDFKLFEKTILVANAQLGLFLANPLNK